MLGPSLLGRLRRRRLLLARPAAAPAAAVAVPQAAVAVGHQRRRGAASASACALCALCAPTERQPPGAERQVRPAVCDVPGNEKHHPDDEARVVGPADRVLGAGQLRCDEVEEEAVGEDAGERDAQRDRGRAVGRKQRRDESAPDVVQQEAQRQDNVDAVELRGGGGGRARGGGCVCGGWGGRGGAACCFMLQISGGLPCALDDGGLQP